MWPLKIKDIGAGRSRPLANSNPASWLFFAYCGCDLRKSAMMESPGRSVPAHPTDCFYNFLVSLNG